MEPLTHALDAERREINGRAGRLSCYVGGDGPPMLLIHSINAAGSAYEVKPVFDHFIASHRVYAPDLPGFGFSDRSKRDYSVRLYTDAVHDVLDMMREDLGDIPVDVMALSLGSEFAARAATETPARFRTLTLVTPTGFRAGSDKLRMPEGETREMAFLSAFVKVPLWRKPLYNLLVRPGTIRYFLKRTYGSDAWDEGMAKYDDLVTHQPGAENAPFAFLSGRLFSADIRTVYERLELPVWLAHGTRGDFRDFSEAQWTLERDNWTKQPFDTGALIYFEVPDAFIAGYTAFLADAVSAETSA